MEERNYKLYVHISPSNKRYYGITSLKKCEDRWQNGYGYKGNKHFINAINKYGWDNIEHIVLFDSLTKEEAQLLEQMYIALYDTTNGKYGYNKDLGGNVPSPETRKKMSESNKGEKNGFYGKHHTQETKDILRMKSTGRQHSKEAKIQISNSLRNTWSNPNSTFNSEEFREKRRESVTGEKNGMYGKTLTEEHKKKISEANTGHIVTEQTRKKMSEALKGHIVTEETRKKLSESHKGLQAGEKHPMYGKHLTEETRKKLSEVHKGLQAGEKHPLYGKHHSEETKKKISESHKGKKHSEETKKKISEKTKGKNNASAKPILMFTLDGKFIRKFDCAADANEYLGKDRDKKLIRMCARGERKNAYGYCWKYEELYLKEQDKQAI